MRARGRGVGTAGGVARPVRGERRPAAGRTKAGEVRGRVAGHAEAARVRRRGGRLARRRQPHHRHVRDHLGKYCSYLRRNDVHLVHFGTLLSSLKLCIHT
jgi:hypothetical protein